LVPYCHFRCVTVTGAIRWLRLAPLYQAIGVIQFTAMAVAAWALGARAITTTFWVGLGPPWVATAADNQMRYLVLTAASIAIVVGFVVFREVLGEADQEFRPNVGFATSLLAGPLYLIFDAFGFGIATVKLHGGETPEAFHDLNAAIDMILFLADALTYIATAAFAVSLGQAGWIRRGAERSQSLIFPR